MGLTRQDASIASDAPEPAPASLPLLRPSLDEAVAALSSGTVADGMSPARLRFYQIVLGALIGALAVMIRLAADLPPNILPFFLVVIAVCLVTVFAGFLGGLTTMITGGLLTWYYLLEPSYSFEITGSTAWTLIGYFSVTFVILGTSQLYRHSEQRRQAVALEMALQEAHHQQLFAREMSHRLKNALSIVQAMANQTFGRGTIEVAKFDGRLRALADAHNLLNEHVQQPTASIAEVVETAIKPFRDNSSRFQVTGPPLPLADQQVVSLSLALHELGTNAVKYGALSHSQGWVSIDWDAGGSQFKLDWKEHDGPPVAAPSSKGFGSRLLARTAMGAKLRFEPDGLRCTISWSP